MMVDWDTLLQPAALGLANSVASIATTERLDLSNVPYVEATVVLPAGITTTGSTGIWLRPSTPRCGIASLRISRPATRM